jgi:hypothetical protein
MFTAEEVRWFIEAETAPREPLWLIQARVLARVRARAAASSRDQVARRLALHGRARAHQLRGKPNPLARACRACGAPPGGPCRRLPATPGDRLAGHEIVTVHDERLGLPAGLGYYQLRRR